MRAYLDMDQAMLKIVSFAGNGARKAGVICSNWFAGAVNSNPQPCG
jgi:hypothetical protein